MRRARLGLENNDNHQGKGSGKRSLFEEEVEMRLTYLPLARDLTRPPLIFRSLWIQNNSNSPKQGGRQERALPFGKLFASYDSGH